jgi:nitrous oxidase accessory protein
MRARTIAFTGLAAAGLALAQAQSSCPPATGLDASGLQALIDVAAPRSTLALPRGEYHGRLVVDKPLTLRAEAGATLIYRPSATPADGRGQPGSALTIVADGILVSGLAVRGSGRDAGALDAGVYMRGRGIRLEGCSVEGALFGIRLDDCVEAAIVSCRVKGDAGLAFASRGDGIRVTGGSDCLVDGVELSFVCDGVYLDGTTRPRVRDARISEGRYGVHVMYGSGAEIDGLVAERLVVGAMVMGTRGATLVGNRVSSGRDARSAGISLFESDCCAVVNNELSGSATGISLDGARDCSIRGNAVAGNARGLFVENASPGTVVQGNRFLDNALQVGGIGDLGSLTWTKDGKGNFWDDYRGYDLDGDGVGDSPYRRARSYSALAAREPLLGAFFGSPLQVLGAGLESGAEIVDPKPLARARE